VSHIDEIKQQAAVMLAYGDKTIQIRQRAPDRPGWTNKEWRDDSGIRPLCFNWCEYEYRIKTEPREWEVLLDDGFEPIEMMTVRQPGEGERGWIRVREVLEEGKA